MPKTSPSSAKRSIFWSKGTAMRKTKMARKILMRKERELERMGVEEGAYTRVFEATVAVFDNQAVFVPVRGDVLGGAEINQ